MKLEFEISRVKYYTAKENYKKANKLLTPLKKFTTFQAFNLFEVLSESFIICCHQKQFDEATSILNEVYESYQFKMLDKMDKAAWSLKAAYLFYAVGHSTESISWLSVSKLPEFFNNCAPISKDKTGYQLQFMIIKVLLLQMKESIDFESELNNLKVYHSRYLKGQVGERSNAFYYALSKLTRAHFSRGSYDSLGHSLNGKLNELNCPIEYCEVMKYEVLWELIGCFLNEG